MTALLYYTIIITKDCTMPQEEEHNIWIETFRSKKMFEEYMKSREYYSIKYDDNKKFCEIIINFLEHYKDNEFLLEKEIKDSEKNLKFTSSEHCEDCNDFHLTKKDNELLAKLNNSELLKLLKILDIFCFYFLIKKISLYLIKRLVDQIEFHLNDYSKNTQFIFAKSFERERRKIDWPYCILLDSFFNSLRQLHNSLEENRMLKNEIEQRKTRKTE